MTEPVFTLQGPIVVRSPNWLGDAVMALPAVRNLKTMLVDDPLTVAAPEKLAALWQKCPFVDEVIPLEKPKNLRHTARQLRVGKFGSAGPAAQFAPLRRRGVARREFASASVTREAAAACF